MKAEIITIGDELLIGQVIDTNSAHIAQQLNDAGLDVVHIASVADNGSDIVSALDAATARASAILITGGLGPTNDDRTKQSILEYFHSGTRFDEGVFQHITELLSGRGVAVNERNREQAIVPDNCTLIPNPLGTAPGLWFEKNNTSYLFMPGVPFEMKAVLSNAMPLLRKSVSGFAIRHKTILTQGLPESMLAKKIEDWEAALPGNLSLAYLPSPGLVRLRLTGRGTLDNDINEAINQQVIKLKKLIPEYIFGYDQDTLESVVGDMLRDKGAWLATAESCTGGTIASMITSVPGSSAYFRGSVVAYANLAKMNLLHVSEALIGQHGAVSREVVEAMAAGAREMLHADYSIATSGIAGPDGGTDDKPVGTVWIAIASPTGIYSAMHRFGDDRERNIRRASVTALNMLRKAMLGSL